MHAKKFLRLASLPVLIETATFEPLMSQEITRPALGTKPFERVWLFMRTCCTHPRYLLGRVALSVVQRIVSHTVDVLGPRVLVAQTLSLWSLLASFARSPAKKRRFWMMPGENRHRSPFECRFWRSRQNSSQLGGTPVIQIGVRLKPHTILQKSFFFHLHGAKITFVEMLHNTKKMAWKKVLNYAGRTVFFTW